MSKNNSQEQNRAPVNTLKQKDVEQFLNKAMKHEILSKRFKTLDKKRKRYLARHMCVALNYSFKYDRVSSLKELIKIHRMMAITKEEVDAFNDLFIKECLSKTLPELSVQRRVLERVGKLIVEGYSNEIDSEEVLFTTEHLKRTTSIGQNLRMLISNIYIRF